MTIPYIAGKGPLGSKLMIVSDCPKPDETKEIILNDPTGAYSSAGIYRHNHWNTYVVKHPIPPSLERRIPFKTRCEMAHVDMHKCIAELRTEIDSIKPNCILTLGSTALYALTGNNKIHDYRGSILFGSGRKIVPTFKPDDLINNGTKDNEISDYWQRQVMIFDMKRALAQSEFPEINRPNRFLHIAESSADLYDFYRRFKNYKNPSVDIEARNCIPICVGLSFTPSEGITVPLWNSGGISKIPTDDLVSVWRILADILYSDVIGQNFGYDRDKIKRLGFIIRSLKSDTMLKAFCTNPELPKTLAFLTSIFTEEPFYKNEGMYEGSVYDLLIGCARDACVTKEIDDVLDADVDGMGLRGYYEQFLLPLSSLYSEIESIGFNTNQEIKVQLLQKYIKWSEDLAYKLFQIAGVTVNVNSPKQVDIFLYESLKIPRRRGTGEEVLTEIINGGKLNEWQKKAIDLVLEKRRVDKQVGNILIPTDFDGRTRTSYFICLDTGRSATSQQSPPIRPAIEGFITYTGKKKDLELGQAFQTITKHGDIGPDIRTQYEADEGEIFIQLDSSQAEARVIALLANDLETLESYDKIDVHAETASWFFGGVEADYSKKVLGYERPERFAGKTLRHAGNLGAKKRRAATELNTQARKYGINFTITEYQAGEALKVFHRKTPKIQDVYHKEVIECLQKSRSLEAPIPFGISSEHGGIRTFFERWGDELYRKGFSYIPQRTVSENTKGAALRIKAKAPWIKILLESHDSLLLSVKIERQHEAVSIAKPEMERPIDFKNCSLSRGTLVIPCDVEVGSNYKDLTKYRHLTLVK